MSEYILEMKGITKTFPGVKALSDVNLKVKAGEIHALCGENGAGKSTLMKVLSGVYPHGSYEGDILFGGEVCQFRDIKDSERLGIVIIHQELALIPYLSISENIFLGNEQVKRGVINWNETTLRTRELLKTVGLGESPLTRVSAIGVGKQQLVEIAKALSKEVKLLILDEPTAALNEDDSENLLTLILELKKRGISSIIISHKLNEIEKIADSVTILRDGRTIRTLDMKQDAVTEDVIIKGMVGRDLTNRYPERSPELGETIFEIRDWEVYHPTQADRKMLDRINMHIRRGEVVGIAGLMGAGRTELAMSVFGKSYGRRISGELYMHGREVHFNDISQAIAGGLAYVTEDRKHYGLILIDDIKRNISLSSLHKLSRHGVIDENEEVLVAEEYRRKLNIKTPSILQKTVNLSGGNQQKVVLSKWIYAQPDVLILDEPTRGIDVGAKYEIYSIINSLAAEGRGVLVISSELPEIIGMCDRIYTMCEGRITGEVQRQDATQELLMKYMTRSRG
ncbi:MULTISPECIES: multiple monosaccharide ABC transporter ATP-binding protein [unclassified Paenibacillus]|uniref:multiple monosaccharide ABC transporter ATP-binding protein n=1 Tax=unclassified Paenibacillus TaxID=185978 RepID=UPI002407470B|nr:MULTISPECIES: multiple monosaccharide ABC transporter ATP-binding protein [unclassified Paenibacillus]MDF9842934.1 putative multiple sugar transport system ATP-binding protein [Paenibacillus sp. PastF-2]MDF9849522.1 putative multiple sugar transport system ATP-binding protein [Paenibacillus sp. PastM-2]MDF9856103.1 putative multiple sugar transport system ATP-binding protein [Paenibacillus sp. PastF-1]MDH6481365.1 putative multiple sugar transport system ATP-binding protein [Paenibacillus sp